MARKLQRDLSAFSKEKRNLVNNDSTPQGLYSQKMLEPIPNYDAGGSENVLRGNNNSFIILGRDRNQSKASGAGGRGFTQCGSIDLVAGLGNNHGKQKLPPDGKRLSPNFFIDAARVYITQKGKIDNYFGLARGSEPDGSSNWKSGIGIKADHVRIIGRNHIKLVTHKAIIEGGGSNGELNSMGGPIDYCGKIDFIAGNYTEASETSEMPMFGMPEGSMGLKTTKVLQPIPKGENLIEFLDNVLDTINDLQKMVFENRTSLVKIATKVASHVHEVSTPFGPTSPSAMLAAQLAPDIVEAFSKMPDSTLFAWNLSTLKMNYLTPEFPTYINSRHVNTT